MPNPNDARPFVRRIVWMSAAGVSLGLIGLVVGGYLLIRPQIRQVAATREKLIDRDDYTAIEADCRELLRRLPEETRSDREWEGWTPAPDDLPPAIGRLGPFWVSVEPQFVRLEFGGGFHHQGLVYFAVGDPEQTRENPRGWFVRQQLTERLWYYEQE